MKKTLPYIVFSLIVFLVLQFFCSYHYMYAEQYSLFLYTKDYFLSLATQPGGLVEYIASFIVQFFYFPYIGALVWGILSFIISLATGLYLSDRVPSLYRPLFSVIFTLLVIALGVDMFCSLSYAIAILLTLLTAFGIRRITIPSLRIAAIIALPLPFYIIAGPAAFLLALIAVIDMLQGDSKAKWFSLLSLLPPAVYAYLIYINGQSADFRHTFLPDAYYNSFVETPSRIYFPYLCLLVLAALKGWIANIPHTGSKRTLQINILVQSLLLVALGYGLFITSHSADTYVMKKLEVMRWHKQWGRILLETKTIQPTHLTCCYTNLALAQKGWLAEQLFSVPQNSSAGLWTKWDGTQYQADLFTDVYMTMGNPAMTQKMAFNTTIFNRNTLSGHLLLKLIQTNLIFGHDAVAEKYIRQLESTLVYDDQASAYRRYLHHPELVDKDSIMGPLKRCAAKITRRFIDTETDDLQWIIYSNPDYRNAIEYLGAKLLLDNNLTDFKNFLEKYRAELSKRPLPRSFQEAALMVLPDNEWQSYGIKDATTERFAQFKGIVAQMGPQSAGAALQGSFANTFWYYSFVCSQQMQQSNQ